MSVKLSVWTQRGKSIIYCCSPKGQAHSDSDRGIGKQNFLFWTPTPADEIQRGGKGAGMQMRGALGR